MTVSRVLREPDRVSVAVRERVTRALRDVGYIPNQLAQGLRTVNRSKVVVGIVPSLRNSLFAQTLQGISDGLHGHALNLMVGDSARSQKEEEALIEAFLAQRPCGFILHDTLHTARARRLLARSGVPVVEIGDLVTRPVDMVVSYSNRRAARAMTEHLLERGHRKIGFVSIRSEGNVRARNRRLGYEDALRAAGAALDERLIVETEGSYRHGGEALITLRQRDRDLRAIFFAGDVLGVGALLACRENGWRVPDDIAIASFDDFEIAASISPRLTALDIPRYAIGRTAAELIVRRLGGTDDTTPVRIDLGFRVLPGESA
jgi:LacI family gluconate utilization system Gnt-I transcriptional repressor